MFLSVFKKKKVWIPLVIVVGLGAFIAYQRSKSGEPRYTTEPAVRQDLVQTVSATGTVEAAEEVNLNFKVSGRLSRMNVKVGDKVSSGQVLALLDAGDAQAAVLTAQANVRSAEAALAKLKAGSQTEDIAVSRASVQAAETALENAKQALANTKVSQVQAVANAWAQLVGLPAVAVPAIGNVSTATVAVTGTYAGTERGEYTIRIENTPNLVYTVLGLEQGLSVPGSRTSPTPLGSRGLAIQFSSSGTISAGDMWTIAIPNTQSTSYASYEAAYQAALTTQKQQVDAAEAAVRAAEQALISAQAQLELKEAPARSYDIDAAEAAVASARASLARAQSDLGDRSLMAPVTGTITQVNNQVGETTSPAQAVLVLLADSEHEVKVQVPESDIVKLQVGQKVDMTLDAFGSNQHFDGHISFIDPASTVVADVVYYEVTVLFDAQDDRIKPGMTANVDVETARKIQVLVVPLRAVKYDNRQAYVEILQASNALERKDVTLGLRGDDGLVEILNGLSEGERVVTFKQNGT